MKIQKFNEDLEKVRIVRVEDDGANSVIEFSNGSKMTFDFDEWGSGNDCYNYPDLSQLEELALKTEFDWPLDFEEVYNSGFRFGNSPQKMFFVPCYSSQNGYYSSDVEVLIDGKIVCETYGEDIE